MATPAIRALRARLSTESWLLLGLAALKVSLHFATNTSALGYGYFRDELYYWVCAMRLDWGYVDHPPLAPFLLRLTSLTLGDSMFAWRFWPALAGGTLVLLTGLMARELGGGRWAQAIAALSVVVSPLQLIIASFFSTNIFEVLLWAMSAYTLVRLLKFNRPRDWLWVGLWIGLGLQTKHTTVFWIVGLAVGVLLTDVRRHVLTPWPWLGGGLALLIFAPNLLWQMSHEWASVEFYRSASLLKNIPTSAIDIVLNQILLNNPLAWPLWLAGLYFYLFSVEGKPYRLLGWVYLTILAMLIVMQSSRPDRPAGAYPMLLAAGAIVIERAAHHFRARWVLSAAPIALTLVGLVLLPLSLPVLSPALTARYALTLGLTREIEQGKVTALPQYFADRFGWEEQVTALAAIYHQLSATEQAQAIFLTSNYGEAGALDFFGRAQSLPRAVSGHNNYYVWGPAAATGEVVITVGLPASDLSAVFETVDLVTTLTCEYCVESKVPVTVARHLKAPLDTLWAQTKHYE